MDLQSIIRVPLEDLPFVVLSLIIAFTVHEFAHAYSAYKFGDDTAYNAGRVTLNPRVHLDVLGTLLIIIAGFGWAKPVPVDRSKFNSPRLMSIIVTAVGPLSNLLMGIIAIFIYVVILTTGILDGASVGVDAAVHRFFDYFIYYNFLLFIFNLIPLPPLDGYRIISDLLPLKLRYKLDQNVQWGMLIFLLIVFIPPLREVTLDPILALGDQMKFNTFATVYQLFNS
ncbi:site-2 protease family protein [Paenibacillus sp. FSL H8-0548]|uniref:site-2 protease family protein n=1 Tax=Paenibacillus sp. FSL H8-0548 TaxID=1920422 RepID=UPI00096F48F6|nr:site-2 protease family protein [Paenibacillus sp. FSL H8-0548]OMF34176.1 site-2 protease family protein [Paenibacillus sp. FSL H8-0548]